MHIVRMPIKRKKNSETISIHWDFILVALGDLALFDFWQMVRLG